MNVPSSKRPHLLAALTLAAAVSTGCVAHRHTVGLGSTGTGATSARQYYLLFGLVELNNVDTQRMAPDLTSYSIETSFGIVDIFWAPFLALLTMTSRTVVVRT